MLLNSDDIAKYIALTYSDVTEKILDRDHIGAYCPICKRDVGLQVKTITSATFTGQYTEPYADLRVPFNVTLKCPICEGLAIWVLYRVQPSGGSAISPAALLATTGLKRQVNIYRIAAIPPEGQHEIPELPENPAALRAAYSEAIRCLDNNCPMSAAAMLRRALQVITREILGAKPSTLANELKSLIGTENKLGVVLTTSFNTHGYILKEVGNQAAHPDPDQDLLSFTHQDAQDLYEIFLKVVAELFVAPAASKKATQGLLMRRKLQERASPVEPKVMPKKP